MRTAALILYTVAADTCQAWIDRLTDARDSHNTRRVPHPWQEPDPGSA